MRCNNAKKFIGEALTVMILTTCSIPVSAQELNTEIASAGAAVELQNYIENAGSEEDLAKYLPAPEQTQQSVETTEKKEESKESKIFSDIAIARVSGEGDYVNVRKKPSVKSKTLGKIYNNCAARNIETTKNGWYKIVSGNCSGYIKAEYFVTGQKAASNALDNGYVFANIKENGIHVRESYTTESAVVTNVYKNENYVIKKFSDDGKWVKVKIGDGVSGWVSADYAKVSVDMETAITNAEERAKIKAQKEREKREREAQLAAQEQEIEQPINDTQQSYEEEQNEPAADNSSSDSGSSNTYNSEPEEDTQTSDTPSYGNGSGAGASEVVAYAKQFLGNPYVYGGSSLTKGTDCSGFTMSVYAHFGYSLNRSSYTQVYNGRAVSLSSLLPGDLLFYKYGGSTISHVAIYIGGGQIIHASTPSTGIIIGGMGSPCAARRIIG